MLNETPCATIPPMQKTMWCALAALCCTSIAWAQAPPTKSAGTAKPAGTAAKPTAVTGKGAATTAPKKDSYLFVWAGDDAKQGEDFLAVLDANPESPKYGQAVASVEVPGPTGTPHHTELAMPPGGYLLANGFATGRTTLFDLRDPQQPKVVTSYAEFNGYMHPHTYIRLKNGNV